MDIAPPSISWGKEESALDAFHHTMYALASPIAYRLLSSRNGAGAPDAGFRCEAARPPRPRIRKSRPEQDTRVIRFASPARAPGR